MHGKINLITATRLDIIHRHMIIIRAHRLQVHRILIHGSHHQCPMTKHYRILINISFIKYYLNFVPYCQMKTLCLTVNYIKLNYIHMHFFTYVNVTINISGGEIHSLIFVSLCCKPLWTRSNIWSNVSILIRKQLRNFLGLLLKLS